MTSTQALCVAAAAAGQLAQYADRPVVRRAVLIAALGNYTHPHTRHSIAQYLLDGLSARAAAHDADLRAQVEQRVRRVISTARKQQQQQQKLIEEAAAGATLCEPDGPSKCAQHSDDPFLLYDLPRAAPAERAELFRAAQGWISKVSFLVDTLPPKGHALRRRADFSSAKYPYVIVDATLYKPKLLMNISGPGVRAAAAFAHVSVPQDILILHDELSRAFGKVSTKDGGSAAGHNGVKSTLDALGCTRNGTDFARVRIGIDRPPPGIDVSRWVLGQLPRDQLAECEWPPSPPATGKIVELVWQQVAAWCGRDKL
ncbi:hypothetical protein MCUN1_003726 [Malassezia cuniculi]|uniref:peptidyl-tRNA hydrolase n=1 Tax=Malassezia cuniculi TaxID=948313 RepID=A0AAF0EZ07_9BASI|nr:hypothetical protein MCUN1_003726 [Malassezia cuniculi]